MLFNSFNFIIFFVLVYCLYLVLSHKAQNYLLLFASYFFYGCWDWRFLFLIFSSTIVDYFCGLKIYSNSGHKKKYLAVSIVMNLGLLGFFKYFNFFSSSLFELLSFMGVSNISLLSLDIVLPVGISFYTFQTMSYTIDIYRGELKPTKRFLDFALFVSFFPQLVAGPIERARHLLPQVLNTRKVTLEKFYKGCYLIFWGYFLKIYVADNLASTVNLVFSGGLNGYNGIVVLLSVYAFAFQIFCDFAGYSSIARGLSKCMGFDLMINFNLPYFALNPSDFWKRWHISLSSWLKDYLYVPLGGSWASKTLTFRNLVLVMLLGGLWHGAGWNFVLWGMYQGFLLCAYRFLRPVVYADSLLVKINCMKCTKVLKIMLMFHLICIGWLFFRAESIDQICMMLKALFIDFKIQRGLGQLAYLKQLVCYGGVLFLIQVFQYFKRDLFVLMNLNVFGRGVVYYFLFYLLVFYGALKEHAFIYFQF